jgi:hypothetical protein
MVDLFTRSTDEVLNDHLRCRASGDYEADLERNYSPDVVFMSLRDAFEGHDGLRLLNRILQSHVPQNYEIALYLVHGPYAFIEWRARGPGKIVEDGTDSFVIRDGKIIFRSIHYNVQEAMPA